MAAVKNKIWIKPLILILIVGGLTIIAYKSGLIPTSFEEGHLVEERLRHFLASLGPAAFIGFILLQIAQVVAAPVPGEVTGLLGGFLYGPFLGVVLSTTGLTIGSYIAFTLSRKLGKPFVEKVVKKSTMERFDYLLQRKGAFLVFLLFLIPGFPKDLLCYILGLGHLSTKEFLVISGIGRLFGTILLTLGGNFIRHHQYGRFFILAGITLVVVLVAMAYKDKLERIFRMWHVISKRKEMRKEKMKKR